MDLSLLIEKIRKYTPYDKSEENDKKYILKYAESNGNCLTRDNSDAHFTSSAWVVNSSHDKVLMVYHNIYSAWSWCGGHSDGEADLLKVSVSEVCEETGIEKLDVVSDDIFSIEVLTVAPHIKNGLPISEHKHLNVTFLIEADEKQKLFSNPLENSDVKWIPLEEAENTPEKQMQPIYKKLNRKLREIDEQNCRYRNNFC